MRRIYTTVVLICLFILPVITGCSGNPVSPDTGADQLSEGASGTSAGLADNVRNNLGYWVLTIDTGTGDAEIVPVRNANLHLNVTGILNTTMGVGVAGVPGESDPANGLIVLDISLTHPFVTKPQLSGFDVMGILMTPGSLSISPLIFADSDETRLLNADGYTRWWNPAEFTTPGMFGYTQGNLANEAAELLTATVNPFKYFTDVLGPTDSMSAVYATPMDDDAGRGVFSAGTKNTRRYEIQFEMNPGPVVKYGYAVGASWATPDINPPGEIPDDFPIEANQPEAFYIAAATMANSLYYDSESGTGGGVLRVLMNIHDWQGIDAGAIADEIEAVRLFSPGLFSGGVDAVFMEETSIRAVYTADLTADVAPTEAGDSLVVIQAGSQDGPAYDQGLGAAPPGNVSAYKVLTVEVIDPDCTADSNDEFIDYINFDLIDPVTGQLCSPTDFKDFYRFELYPGFEISGNLILYCDAEPTRIELYDINEVKITETDVSGGTATIDLDVLVLLPGQYYIRVVTQTTDQAFLYMLEFDGEVIDLTPNPVSVTPEMLYFEPNWVTSDENYAYYAGPQAFWIFDLAMDPDSLPISRTHAPSSGQPGVHYPYACVFEDTWIHSGVSLMDIADPADPVVYEDIYPYSEEIHAVAMDSEYICVAVNDTVDEKLVILDYSSDPSSPTVLSDTFVFEEEVKSLDVFDPVGPAKYLIALYSVKIHVIDISDPANPSTNSSFYWTSGEIRDITVEEYFIHAIYSNVADLEYFQIIEFSDTPFSGIIHGNTVLTQDCRYLDVRGDYAYLTDDANTATVVDISNIASPTEGTMNAILYRSGYVHVNGTRLFIIHPHSGVVLYDASEVSDLIGGIGDILGVNHPISPVVDGDYMYATQFWNTYNWSIMTLDISDPENIELVALLPVSMQLNGLWKTSYGLIARSVAGTFWMINNNNPMSLNLPVEVNPPNDILGMVTTGTYLYMADDASQLRVFSLTSWPTPNPENTISVPSNLFTLIINGNALYATSNDKIYVFSLVDPNVPVLEDTFIASASAVDITTQGNYLYALTTDAVEILDISDPFDLVPVSSVPTTTTGWEAEIAVNGQFAWVGMNSDNSWLYRIWPPESPVELGKFYETEWTSSTWDFVFIGDYYIDTRFPYGMEIMDMYP